MAFNHRANTIVCDAGSNTLPGPIDIEHIESDGAVEITKGGNNIVTFGAAGNHECQLRSASDIVVTGACTIFLRRSRHS